MDAPAIADILLLVEASREYVRGNPETGLPKHRFDTVRGEILVELGVESRKGIAPWPPTSQTVMKRLGAGAWADALSAIGLTPDTRGRPRGLLAFTADQYQDALAKFSTFAEQTGQPATYEAYGEWVDQEERAGRHWPAPASVRLRFGSWIKAKRSSAGANPMRATAASTITSRHAASEAALALHQAQHELRQIFEKLSQIPAGEARTLVEAFVKSFVQEFEFRRRTWLRSMVASDPGAVARRLSDPQLPNKQRLLLEAQPPDVAGALTDMFIDKLISPRNTGGWIGVDAQAEMDAISEENVAKFMVLREARNFFTHNSVEAQARLKARLSELSVIDSLFEINQQLTSRVFLVWLLGSNARRLRSLVECMPNIWRAAVVAETVAVA